MKKTVEMCFCDLCKKEAKVTSIKYPVIFHSNQTDGYPATPYISYQDLDVCVDCGLKVLQIEAVGAQGNNEYWIKGERK